jgi:pectate lyase
MDLEFLFSSAPFVNNDHSRFSTIQPAKSQKVALSAQENKKAIALPAELKTSNVFIEIRAKGKVKSNAYYANDLNVVLSENYGQIQVKHADGHLLPKTYVKVFAEVAGRPQFYKDGYTDLRGKFDYASLSTNQLDQATRFSILVMSDAHGASVLEAKPPRQ